MKPHPRIRKAVKWGGASVSMVLMVAWVGSMWFGVQYMTRRGSGLAIASGRLCCFYLTWSYLPRSEPSFEAGRIHVSPNWWFYGWRGSPASMLHIPLWFPLTLSLIATAVAWRLDALARARAGLCPKCHYDLKGLAPGAKCPECGGAEAK